MVRAKQTARKSVAGYSHYLKVKKDSLTPVQPSVDDNPAEENPAPEGSKEIEKGPIQSPTKAATPEKGKEPEPECSPEKPIVISSDSSEGYTPLSDNESVGYFPRSESKSEGYTPLDHAESDECTSPYFLEE